MPSCKVPIILVYVLIRLEFSRQFSKNTQISNFAKIHPLGAELFVPCGLTDMMSLIVTFGNFANAP